MKSIKETIWAKPMYLPYVHEVLTDETVKTFEQKIGYKLPQSLIDLLKIQNGGYTRYRFFPDIPPVQIRGIGTTFPNLISLEEDLGEVFDDYRNLALENVISFDGDGHYYYCLDYRKNQEIPQISFIDLESDEQRVIAENFDEFLNQLALNTDNLWVIKSEKSLVEIVEVFKNQLVIKFDEPDDFDYGYTQYRAKYGGHWLWLSPNQVPFAFARKGDKNFNRLKDYEGKTASRFPEIDARYTLISTYNEELALKLINEVNGIFEIVRLSDLLSE